MTVVPPPTPLPRAAPRRRPRTPADAGFVLFALLVGFLGVPAALGLGMAAGASAAPPPLQTPDVLGQASTASPDKPSDAMRADLTAIGAAFDAINASQRDVDYAQLPVVVVTDGEYTFSRGTYAGDWTADPIPVSDGIDWGGQYGYDEFTWCVWLTEDGVSWHVGPDGIAAGSCLPGG